MSDVKVEHKVVMTRTEAAQWIADVGKALSGILRKSSSVEFPGSLGSFGRP